MANKRIMYLLSDVHLMWDKPSCRVESDSEFIDNQFEKLEYISHQARGDEAPILISGDVFDKARSANILARRFIQTFKNNHLIIIPGQHDLPYHNLSKLEDSSLGVIEESLAKIKVIRDPKEPTVWKGVYIFGIPFGITLSEARDQIYNSNKRVIDDSREMKVLMLHTLISNKESEVEMMGSADARMIVKLFHQFNVILSGDNHRTFIQRFHKDAHSSRVLINPGSLVRKTASQVDHRPVFFKYFVDEDIVKKIYIPVKEGVISREHLSDSAEIDQRSRAFIEKLSSGDFGLSFKDNVRKAIRSNKLSKETITIINEAMDQ